MELLLSAGAALALLTIAVCSFLVNLWRSHSRCTKSGRLNLPPGSMGWPILGENFQHCLSLQSQHPHAFYEDRRLRYGEVFKTHIFGYKSVVCLDPEFNKFVLLNEGKLFEASYPRTTIALMGKNSIINIHGPSHSNLYRKIVSFLNTKNLRSFYMEEIEDHMVETLESWRDRETMLLQKEIKHASLCLMVKQLVGFIPQKETRIIIKNFTKVMNAQFSMPINIPWCTYSKGLKARNKIVEIFTKMIEERRRLENYNMEFNDMIGKMMSCKDFNLSHEEMIDFLFSIALGSNETTSMIMTCLIPFLQRCPQAYEELREEHDALRQSKRKNDKLTWEEYKSMNFTRMVINETLRLASVPIIPRKTLEDIKIQGYIIPKGWHVVVPLIALHLDKDVYSNPLEFNPWRWKEKDEKANPSFLVFGGGPRYCAGSEFARLEISIFLHHFITKFRWKIAESCHMTWFPLPNIRNHLQIQLMDRNGA